ncbi:MAG: amidohydrolase family protein [Gaiellaceae bacterium MAG52_C11]|nr:amidohydrolase family protein [Candidatus Gaiellasilicea maunaloa]
MEVGWAAVILENGIVRTLDPSLPASRALAIAGPLVAGGVGVHESALASPETIDLGGRCVLPAFTDSHVHFPTWALAQRQVKLDGCRSLEEALARIRAAAAPKPNRWLRGYGWRDGDWDLPTAPTKEALDEVTGETPAIFISKDYHSVWLNSAALAHAGGDLEVEGGVVERDERGEPTGILREEAAWRFRDRYVVTTQDEWVEATRAGLGLANARGVCAVHDKDGWLGSPGIFQRLREEGNLSLRVWGSIPHDLLDQAAELSLRSGFGDEFLRIGYLKCFMDGTLGSQTALLTDGSGVRITSREELEEVVRRGAESGWPVAVHAIGDQANRDALDAFEATRDAWQPLGLRHRIEHAQCLTPEDLPRFAALGIACSVQFSHAPSDRDLAERFWPDRLDGAYSFGSLWESGALLANGSDAPVEELDPLAGIAAGVTRTIDGRPAWRPEETLTVEQALQATCVNPARLSGDERRRGRLLPGYLADAVVLDRDPFAVEPEELAALEVVATMVGGRWVHNPPPWD